MGRAPAEPVIVLDTHAWVWWVQRPGRLSDAQRTATGTHQADGLCVSAISCWEVAKLTEYGRLDLGAPLAEWLSAALTAPGVRRVPLSDKVIVATARRLGVPLVTSDRKILDYDSVQTVA